MPYVFVGRKPYPVQIINVEDLRFDDVIWLGNQFVTIVNLYSASGMVHVTMDGIDQERRIPEGRTIRIYARVSEA